MIKNWNNWLYADRLGEEKQTPKPQTNADCFRAMSDDEQQKCVRRFWEIEDFADWLKQPADMGGDV